jgi:hypothetical protein
MPAAPVSPVVPPVMAVVSPVVATDTPAPVSPGRTPVVARAAAPPGLGAVMADPRATVSRRVVGAFRRRTDARRPHEETKEAAEKKNGQSPTPRRSFARPLRMRAGRGGSIQRAAGVGDAGASEHDDENHRSFRRHVEVSWCRTGRRAAATPGRATRR